FLNEFREEDERLAARLADAIEHTASITLSAAQARLISSICIEAQVAGHRADVVIERAARALAAYRGRHSPSRDDVYDAAELALTHRARQPVRRERSEETQGEQAEQQETGESAPSEGGATQPASGESEEQATSEERSAQTQSGQQATGTDEGVSAGGAGGTESAPDAAQMFQVKKIELPRQRRQ